MQIKSRNCNSEWCHDLFVTNGGDRAEPETNMHVSCFLYFPSTSPNPNLIKIHSYAMSLHVAVITTETK